MEEIEYFELLDNVCSLEKDWRKKLHKYSDRELVEIFPESREIIPIKIKEWGELLEMESLAVKEALKSIYKAGVDDFSIWFGECLVRIFFFPRAEACQRHIERLKRLRHLFTDRSKKERQQGVLWEDSVHRARSFPIEQVARGQLELKACGSKYSSRCPFHEEKHASFFLYPETNTYYCFGCQAHGDAINLAMHLHNLTFKDAVSLLTKHELYPRLIRHPPL